MTCPAGQAARRVRERSKSLTGTPDEPTAVDLVGHGDRVDHGGSQSALHGRLDGSRGGQLQQERDRFDVTQRVQQRLVQRRTVIVERTSVGLDAHARVLAVAAINGVTGAVFRSTSKANTIGRRKASIRSQDLRRG